MRALFVFLSFLIFANTDTVAQFAVQNAGKNKIQVALGYYAPTGWTTVGWYLIEPNQTTNILNTPLSNRYFYIYGTVIGCDADYSGDQPFLIDLINPFSIANADKPQSNPKFTIKNFRKVDVGTVSKYTLSLTNDNCLKNGLREGTWTIYYDRDFEVAVKKEDASYYREIIYQGGKPFGYVRDYFISGKKQWEGKLLSDGPDVMHGTCTWYYENGTKQMECVYDKGLLNSEIKEWSEDGAVKQWHYEYETALPLTSRGVSSEYNKYGQRSRTTIPVELPQNTEYYIFRINVGRKDNSQENRQLLIDLLGEISPTSEFKAATKLASILNSSAGDEKLSYFLTDKKNSEDFMSTSNTEIPCWYRGQNIISETRICNAYGNNRVFICLDNQNYLDGVVVEVEVVAVVKKYDN